MTESARGATGWDEPALAAALDGCRFGQPLRVVDETESTNDLAWAEAARGAPEGLLVLADCQTRGRGRGGSAWHSPPGTGVWVSFLLRPRWAPARRALLSLAGGLALAEAVERAGILAGLKWPNDLLAPSMPPRKLGGVLAEARTESDGQAAVVLGIGVNVNAGADDFPVALRGTATSLAAECGRLVDRHAVLVELARALDRAVARLEAGAEREILDGWRARAVLFGRTVRVRGSGTEVVGIARDLAADGALIVRLDSGAELAVHAGQVDVLWDAAVAGA